MAGQAPPQGPIPDLRSIEELLQAPTDGVRDAIVVPPILANQFELKTVPPDVIKLMLFPFSLEGAAQTWIDKEPPNSITTWNDLVSKFVNHFFPSSKTTNLQNEITRFQQRLAGGNFLTKNTQEALTIIENKSKVQTSRNKPQVASASRSSAQDAHISSLTKQVEALLALHRPVDSAQNGVNSDQNGYETCGGPHPYFECQATGGYTQDVYATSRTYNQGGNSYQPLVGPSVPPSPLFTSKEVDQEPETLTDPILTKSTTSVTPLVVQLSPASTELPPAPISSHVIPEPNPHQPLIPYPSRLNKEKLQGKADIQIHSFLQMFKKIHFNISFAEALAHMPKFAKMVKDLLTNKEKLLELANTPLNENCSAVLLKKLPENLRDTRSINLMPLSMWKTLSLPDLSTTRMTLKLATRTVAYPAGIAENVFVQVGKFTFPDDFVVVDYEVDPRVPLILGRPFLRTAHALVDVHG
ncbi:reverse transcriptase domain-containing protein [Tanacetum coccineum]